MNFNITIDRNAKNIMDRYDDHSRKRDGILPDYPLKGKFQTKEEVDDYFSGERIQCLLCGKWFKRIGGIHLAYKHDVSGDEYREMYGLPWKRGLTAKPVYEKRSEMTKKYWADGKIYNVFNMLSVGKHSPKRPAQPFQRDLYKKKRLADREKKDARQWKDYEAIIDRMRTEQRTLTDVCTDSDLPKRSAWNLFVKRHPEFVEKAGKIHYSLPYTIQLKCHDVSPRYRIDCERLRATGMGMQEIANAFGVQYQSVLKTLMNYNKKMGIGRINPYRKWRRGDFEKILERMRTERRVVTDVCMDLDLPMYGAWGHYAKKRPEFAEKARAIHYSLPYAAQIKLHDISPQLRIDCERLRGKGMTLKKIANALGVNFSMVLRSLENFNRKLGLSRTIRFKKWSREYFEKILERMKKEQRTLKDVCRDTDFPKASTWNRFAKEHPEFTENAQKIHYSFPYALQVKHLDVSPRFRVDCERLRAKGMTFKSIAFALGVSYKVALNILKSYDQKMGLAPIRYEQRWSPRDFEIILERMQKQKRTVWNVCQDPDLPTYPVWTSFVKKHPEFAEKARRIKSAFSKR